MFLLLQAWGGGFYLLNKILLSVSERARRKQALRRLARSARAWSWIVYLIGLPAWIVLFVVERDWIAAGVEASGAPSMFLGLVIALRGSEREPPKWLDRLALGSIPFGFLYSAWDYGGFSAPSQWLETGLVVGFLVGTYQLAKDRLSGYIWYVLMHVCCGALMWMQHYPWLLLQQLLSLGFIADAYWTKRFAPIRPPTAAT